MDHRPKPDNVPTSRQTIPTVPWAAMTNSALGVCVILQPNSEGDSIREYTRSPEPRTPMPPNSSTGFDRPRGDRHGVLGLPRRGRQRVHPRKRRHPDVAQHGYQGSGRGGGFAGALRTTRGRCDPDRCAQRNERAGTSGGGARPLDDCPEGKSRGGCVRASRDARAANRARRQQRFGRDERRRGAGAAR